jgi:DNA-directed RNA polymerase specialized sigma24 family protein
VERARRRLVRLADPIADPVAREPIKEDLEREEQENLALLVSRLDPADESIVVMRAIEGL